MNFKFCAVLFFLALFSLGVFGVSLNKHEVNITVNDDGFAVFDEKYYLGFDDQKDLDAFLNKSKKNGKDFILWKQDYSFIFPRFSRIDKITKISNAIFYSNENVFEISYERQNSFALKTAEDSRSSYWNIHENEFISYLVGTTIDVPDSTKITINLSEKAFIDSGQVSGEVQVVDKEFIISGFRGSNIKLNYTLQKPIVASVSTDQLIKDFFSNQLNNVLIIAIIILVIFLFVKRKPVVKKIEDFVINNSEFEKGQEDFEL